MTGEEEQHADNVLVEDVNIVTVGVCRNVVEGEVPGKHGVGDDAAVLDVDGAADVEALADDKLGRSVTGAATARSS